MEIWKDIPGFEGSYQASNLGRLKGLSRMFLKNGKYPCFTKEQILKQIISNSGYFFVNLCVNTKRRTIQTHKLMAITFLNHTPCGHKCVVDHKNNIKTDNRLENLQLISHRENLSKDKKGCSSKYTGVSYHKNQRKWQSSIRVNGKPTYLGSFDCEIEASIAYQNKLSEILQTET